MSGLLRLFSFLPQFFPPYFSWEYAKGLIVPITETLEMAAGGVLIALVVGLLSGIWIASGLPGGRIWYGVLTAFRSIPDLTLAIFCVVVVGIGPGAGMIALSIFYSAAIGKIFADLFLSADPNPVEALRATGAGRLMVVIWGRLPLRLHDVLSYGAYEFESAVRASVIVGAVGGGGLGTEIVGTINALDYRRTTTLIIALVLLIAVIDQVAVWIKRRPVLVCLAIPLAALALYLNRPVTFAFAHSVKTFSAMLPPKLASDAIAKLPQLLLETLEISVFGTLLAVLFGLLFGLLAARNLSPVYLVVPTRRVLETLRAIPEVVWGLLFVSAIGVGPQVGVAALALHATGALGRLYAESFENVPMAPVQSLRATGAGRIATALFGFLPLALGPIAVHTIFRLEWNTRAATIVGVIGAGGLGGALYDAQQLQFYPQMMAYIVIIWLLVLGVDQGSAWTRRRLRLMEVHA